MQTNPYSDDSTEARVRRRIAAIRAAHSNTKGTEVALSVNTSPTATTIELPPQAVYEGDYPRNRAERRAAKRRR